MKKIINHTPEEKKAILLTHYSLEEICDIMGFNDESNDEVDTPEMNRLNESTKIEDQELFKQKMLDKAIINDNFKEVIWYDTRLEI